MKGSQKLILTAVRRVPLPPSRRPRLTPRQHAKGEECSLPLQSLGTRQTIKEAAMGLRHPFILPVLHLDFLPGSNDVMLVFRPFIPKGSIKDLIYEVRLALPPAGRQRTPTTHTHTYTHSLSPHTLHTRNYLHLSLLTPLRRRRPPASSSDSSHAHTLAVFIASRPFARRGGVACTRSSHPHGTGIENSRGG